MNTTDNTDLYATQMVKKKRRKKQQEHIML